MFMTSKVPQMNSPSLVRCQTWKDKVQGTCSQPPQKLLKLSHSPATSTVTPGQPQPPHSLEMLQQDARFLLTHVLGTPRPLLAIGLAQKRCMRTVASPVGQDGVSHAPGTHSQRECEGYSSQTYLTIWR